MPDPAPTPAAPPHSGTVPVPPRPAAKGGPGKLADNALGVCIECGSLVGDWTRHNADHAKTAALYDAVVAHLEAPL